MKGFNIQKTVIISKFAYKIIPCNFSNNKSNWKICLLNKILCSLRNIFYMSITIYTIPSEITDSPVISAIIEVP